MTVTSVQQQASLTEQRLAVPLEDCEVLTRKNLESYRALYRKWMQWYEYSPENPNTIQGQIISMLFQDLTYRSVTHVRGSVAATDNISARSSTLAYIIDTGYLANQVLAIGKLVDRRRDVVSMMRLVTDIQKHRTSITREVYVSGFGDPYDWEAYRAGHDGDIEVQLWGLHAPGRARWLYSYDAHRRFDLLSGATPENRSRDDLIRSEIFNRIIGWLSIPAIDELKSLRNNFLAHASDALLRGEKNPVKSMRFGQLDEAQRAIIRSERAITDCLVYMSVARDVIGIPPLGIFSGLDYPYSTPEGQEQMHKRWTELKEEREGWKDDILDMLGDQSQAQGG
jgi:hypothetical protein